MINSIINIMIQILGSLKEVAMALCLNIRINKFKEQEVKLFLKVLGVIKQNQPIQMDINFKRWLIHPRMKIKIK